MKMKVSTLLTAMALLAGAASLALNTNLNNILEVIPTPTEMSALVRAADLPAVHAVSSSTLNCLFFFFQNYWNYVEDLSHLAQGINKCRVRGVFLFLTKDF